jgi:HK97 family phage major capsid protein
LAVKTTEELRQELTQTLESIRSMAKAAEGAGRDFTPAERSKVDELRTRIPQLKARLKDARDDDALAAEIKKLGDQVGSLGTPSGPRIATGSPGKHGAWADVFSGMGQTKALDVTAGGTAVPVAFDLEIHGLPARRTFVRSLIPAEPQTAGDKFSYLRQTVRENNAAPVAPGEAKPTTVLSIEKVEDTVRTIAHLSEPLQRQQLSDISMLEQFVEGELRLGLILAEEAQIISGDGLGENLTGILETSGIQVQVWDTDLLTTTRKAITKIEDVPLTPGAFVFNSEDWERIELLKDDQSRFYNPDAPIDRQNKRLWGLTVISSPIMPVGTGLVGAFADSAMIKDREQSTVDWSENVSDDFTKNLRRYRAEERLGFAVMRPLGFTEIDLTAL